MKKTRLFKELQRQLKRERKTGINSVLSWDGIIPFGYYCSHYIIEGVEKGTLQSPKSCEAHTWISEKAISDLFITLYYKLVSNYEDNLEIPVIYYDKTSDTTYLKDEKLKGFISKEKLESILSSHLKGNSRDIIFDIYKRFQKNNF